MSTPSRPLSGMASKAAPLRPATPQRPATPGFKVLQTHRAPAQLPLFQGPRGSR